MRVAGIVLAAGGSSRLGRPKQLVRIDGVSLVRRAAETLLDGGVDRAIVVIPPDAAPIRAELADLPVVLVENAEWREGISSSLRAALAHVPAHEGVLVTLCDQPRVTSAHLRALLAREGAIVATAYGGTLGVPAYFAPSLVPELRALQGDVGARRVIAQHAETIAIAFEDAAYDIDTPEDLPTDGGSPDPHVAGSPDPAMNGE